MPSGNVRIGDLNSHRRRPTRCSAAICRSCWTRPIRTGTGPTVYLRDIGVVENGTDIVTGYAHVNGRRTVYIPVTKRADASTLDVIRRVREALPRMQGGGARGRGHPPRVRSVAVRHAALCGTWSPKALLGALLTGLMVLLFLRDWRSALIVVATIPFALLAAVVWLWAVGQTINIMTLGGLALAVGVLVDEATVEIENIHTHMARRALARARAVVDACRKTAMPAAARDAVRFWRCSCRRSS